MNRPARTQRRHPQGEAGEPLEQVVATLPSARSPTISQLATPEWVAVETVIAESVVREIIPKLKSLGAEGIVEYPLNKIVH